MTRTEHDEGKGASFLGSFLLVFDALSLESSFFYSIIVLLCLSVSSSSSFPNLKEPNRIASKYLYNCSALENDDTTKKSKKLFFGGQIFFSQWARLDKFILTLLRRERKRFAPEKKVLFLFLLLSLRRRGKEKTKTKSFLFLSLQFYNNKEE